MTLTDITIRNAKPRAKPYKLADERGLFLLVQTSGGKLWRWKYRIDGADSDGAPKRIERKLTIGTYPELGLSDARVRCEDARRDLSNGIDPSIKRQRQRTAAKLQATMTFSLVANEYIDTKMKAEKKAPATISKAKWFLELLTPAIGSRPIAEIEPAELLAVLKRLEAAGKHETAKKTRSFAGRVFRYGVATTRCKEDPAALLKDALIAPTVRHHAAIIDPAEVGALLRAIDGYTGNPITRFALQIAPHVFVRPGELRHAEWSEFDVEAAIWRIPAGKMKLRRPHDVPLSEQVIALLRALADLMGQEGYLFPSVRSSARPMSENTLNAAFRRMGFTNDEMTAHGFRSTASTLLNESGKWNPDAIERALAHGDSDATRGAYHRGKHWEERVKMAQWWSDHLDLLKAGGAKVSPIRDSKKLTG